MFGSRFLDNDSTDSEKVYSLGNCDSSTSFTLVQAIRHLYFLTPKIGLKKAYRRPRVTQMAGLINAVDVILAAVAIL